MLIQKFISCTGYRRIHLCKIMRRMRMRSSLFGSFATPSGTSGTARSVAAGGGGGDVSGGCGGGGTRGGGSSNHSESRKEAGDRWRMLYYQVRLSQQEDSTRNTPQTNRVSYTHRNIEMSGLNPLKWKMRTFAYVSVAMLVFFMLFIFKKNHHVTFEGVIKDTNPKVVWEFVADFSNMKKLNPTLENFKIVAESGNYDHWKYSAHYTEHLSHAPMIKNHAQSHFAIKPDGDGFLISSEHRTCFSSTFGCLDSVSEFKFFSEGQNTKCVETIQYECPIVFSTLCRMEVMYQREEIMKNLKSHFLTINIRASEDK